jgi:hypothetical protein
MKFPSDRTLLIVIFGGLIIFLLLFSYKVSFHFGWPIDAGRFSDFGTFLAGIFGVVNFALLVLVYRETSEQSINNNFFSQLKLHDSLVRELKSKESEIVSLNSYARGLFNSQLCENITDGVIKEECFAYKRMPDANGYFEVLYKILHLRYRYKKEKPGSFIKDEYWRIGHFFRSFVSIVEFVKENKALDENKRKFFTGILKARSTSDEIRLVFYYVISRDIKKNIANLFHFETFDFFDDLEDPVIYPTEDMAIYRGMLTMPKSL